MFRIGLPFAAPALAELFLVGLTVGLRGSDQLLPVSRIGLPSATAPLEDLFLVRLMVGARIRDLFLSKLLIFGVAFAQLFEVRAHMVQALASAAVARYRNAIPTTSRLMT